VILLEVMRTPWKNLGWLSRSQSSGPEAKGVYQRSFTLLLLFDLLLTLDVRRTVHQPLRRCQTGIALQTHRTTFLC